jgi:hypothetical protein
MPRIFSIEMADDVPDEALDDEDFYPFEAPPEAFQYVPAPDFGPAGPVYVAVNPSQVGKIERGPDAFERFAGKRPDWRDEFAKKAEAEAARFAAALAALGAKTVYARYDGGNDEGFAWFDHCVMADGSTRDADQVAIDLEAAGISTSLRTWGGKSPTRNALDDFMATTWAVHLLGRGYGTGEYVMYGAFSVDLTSGLVTDDINPAPITRNLRFKEQ